MIKFLKINWFWGVVILIILLRFSIVSLIYAQPDRALDPDSDFYLILAEEILEGNGYQGNSSPAIELFRTPGYPLFIAAVFLVFGESIGNISFVQLGISALTGLLLYKLLLDKTSEVTAKIGLILFLFEPTTILWSLAIMTETLFTFFVTLAIFLLLKWTNQKKHSQLVIIGIIIGIATYIRPFGVILAFIISAWILMQGHPIIKSNTKQYLKIYLIPSILLYLSFWAVTVPWTMRNSKTYDCPAFSTVSTFNLRDWMAAKVISEVQEIPIETAIEQLQQNNDSTCDLNKLKYIKILLNNPIPYLKLHLGGTLPILFGNNFDRIVLIVGEGYELPDLWEPYLEDGFTGVASILLKESIQRTWLAIVFIATLIYQLLLLSFSIWGLFNSVHNKDAQLNWWVVLMVMVVMGFLFIPGPIGRERMRVPAIPIIIYFTSIGLMAAVKKYLPNNKKNGMSQLRFN
ncbi:MAG: glycosyltransferase family 39 protein [Chloroflexi bacterium]|nr:glycosyltransferase family 39 protein [Chloroflexota bacterium]